MGQSLSGDQEEALSEEICRQARQLAEVATLTYEEFQDDLKKLNKLAQQCMDAEGKQLVFVVKEGSDSNVFWKGIIRITCLKIDPATKSIETHRVLNLNQFLKVYKSMSRQCAAVRAEEVAMVAYAGKSTNIVKPEVAGECCICLERQPNMLLPCTHAYCRVCIDQWSDDHRTCPICREEANKDEAWVMSEVPNSLEMNEEICATLMELVERQTSADDSAST